MPDRSRAACLGVIGGNENFVHWQELGDTLAPDNMGLMFSGSAMEDRENTSGLGKDGKPPLVLIYTAAGNPTAQGIASSTEGPRFTKFSGNPVLKHITGGNLEPKVFWLEPTKRCALPLCVETNQIHTVHFFGSPDLRDWTYLSRSDGFHECPDFFELPVDATLTEDYATDPMARGWHFDFQERLGFLLVSVARQSSIPPYENQNSTFAPSVRAGLLWWRSSGGRGVFRTPEGGKSNGVQGRGIDG